MIIRYGEKRSLVACASTSCLWLSFALILLLVLIDPVRAADESEATGVTPVTIGVLANRDKEICHQQWDSTAEYLAKNIPHHDFSILCLEFSKVASAVEFGQVDFVLTNPAQYASLEKQYGVSRILTLINKGPIAQESRYGGVIFVRDDRKELQVIADLNNIRFAATDELSFGGWLAPLRLLRSQGIDPQIHFKELYFTGGHDAVVQAVLVGRADAGSVRTDTLERMAAEGKIDLGQIRVLDKKSLEKDDFPFLLTTQLYPEWPLARIRNTSEDLAKKIAIALLSVPTTADTSDSLPIWNVPLDYQPVHDCLKELKVAPYNEPAAIPLAALVDQYLKSALALLFIVLSAFGLLVYFIALNNRLKHAVAVRDQELGERLKAEAEKESLIQDIINSENKFKSLFDSVNDAVFVHPLLAEGFGNFLEINATGCQRYGYSRDELFGKTMANLLVPEDAAWFGRPEYRRDLLEVGSRNVETTSITRDGTLIPVEINENVLELQGHNVIITLLRDRRERLRVEIENRRLVTAIEQSSEVVVITDAAGTIQYVNPAFERNFGYSAKEVIGQNPRILKSGKHDKEFYQKMWKQLLKGETWRGMIVNKRRDGSLIQEHLTISPIKNSKKIVTNYVAVKRDISREMFLEKQLQQSAKMEAIGTLAGGIAHDFNNILAVILGSSQLAKRKLAADHPVQEELQQIFVSGQRAAELVKQILTFSRQREDDLKPLQIQIGIKEALKLLRATLPANITLETQIDNDCPAVLADASKIHQLLMNLCSNAKHALGRKGGVLSVSISQCTISESEQQIAPGLAKGSYVRIEVKDTGNGISPEIQDKIFEPFFTTKEVGGGTGLGLAIVHSIVESHYGKISVRSEPEKGTTVQIFLPVLAADSPPETVKDELIEGGHERILLVDDEQALCQILQRWLEIFGFTVTVCKDGQEALECFIETPDCFDVIVTDMTMPKMSGLELAKEVLSRRPEMPIILCTGYSDFADEEKAKKAGIKDFLLKPIDSRRLVQAISKALGK